MVLSRGVGAEIDLGMGQRLFGEGSLSPVNWGIASGEWEWEPLIRHAEDEGAVTGRLGVGGIDGEG